MTDYLPMYDFSDTGCQWQSSDASETKRVLGGKGAGLVRMVNDGMPVPPGFTITTDVCNKFRVMKKAGVTTADVSFIDGLVAKTMEHMATLEKKFGFMPLVSVRSGAPVSMPGMMDTILNVGLTTSNVDSWGDKIGERAAFDSYRRLITMLGATAFGVPMAVFDGELAAMKVLDKAVLDTDLTVGALKAVSFLMTQKFQAATQKEFPNTLGAQLAAAILAVFDSWESPRAIEYRKLNSIPDDMGTAVTIQAMVFGNMGKSSGTGVLFTRNPSTGEPGMFGEFLENAQGEDVVAGIRTPHPVEGMIGKWNYNTNGLDFTWPDVHAQLLALCSKLETIYNDMVDIEFTVQQGKLYILQSRSGKRSARAAFRIAVDKVGAGEWTRLDAFKKLSSEQFKTLRRPQIDPDYKVKPDFTGIPGCPGVVTAQPVFSSADAVAAKFDCILVTHETSPNDIAGMAKAKGILTAMGGATSHAAVVARAMDKTCVVGVGPHMLDNAGKWKTVTIDGSTGRVWINQEVPVIDASDDKAVQNVIDWSFEMLGTCPPVPCDMGAAKPHRIMASQWWGSEEVMTAVLDGLAALPMRMHVTLDVRPPKAFLNEADDTLRETFGNLTVKTDPFVKVLQNAIKIRGKALAGLIIDHDGHTAAPKAMPAEYAVFSVLGA